jgi:hypothetical protein
MPAGVYYVDPDATQGCLRCGARITAAADDRTMPSAPAAGDWSVCWYCCNVAVYVGIGLMIRAPFPSELEEIASDADLARAIELVQAKITAREKAAVGLWTPGQRRRVTGRR